MSTGDTKRPGPDARIILLGASNLTLGLPHLVSSLHSSLPGHVDVVSAHGHGRSYLRWSSAIYRSLPSIRDCELWKYLDGQPDAQQTYALITDLGCDLFYGEQPDAIIRSVTQCMQRLGEINAKLVFARPPLERLYEMSDWQYYIAKNIFFPGPTVPWATMRDYITEVDTGVLEVAESLGATSIAPKREWYGLDPIHMTSRKRRDAWREILEGWDLPESFVIKTPSLKEKLHIWTRRPARRKLWRIPQKLKQPVYRMPNGSTLALF